MSKNLRQLREKASTKGSSVKLKPLDPPKDNTPATQHFYKKHVAVHHPDRAGNGDDVYNASNITPVKRSPEHGYDPGQDEKVYEETIQEKTLTAAEKAKREEIVLAMKKKNPKMPLGQLYAIATAQAIKVAESVEESETSIDEMKLPNIFKKNSTKKAEKLAKSIMSGPRSPWTRAEDAMRKTTAARYWKQDSDTKDHPEVKNWVNSLKKKHGIEDDVAVFMNADGIHAYHKGKLIGSMPQALKQKVFQKNDFEQILTNLYDTLNEDNKEVMLKLMESEEGIASLVEFAIEKGID